MNITHAKFKNNEFMDTVVETIELTVDGVKWGVPKDPDNTMYQAYLEWAKTNTTEAAD
tara:strand:+ start:238 stop:411 length:174 start_codon:yes stop_codon:yes gene_type:complete